MSDVTSQLRSKCPEKANEKRKVVRTPVPVEKLFRAKITKIKLRQNVL